ncbi:MAG: hypothetical protein C4527_05830 [Candidatus Omnitrophota bacterium]|jgi:hypothetical protein|nr:MAG: hypothetical protein C4527_05830 [Candidatus Omnitrophota bacterium]
MIVPTPVKSNHILAAIVLCGFFVLIPNSTPGFTEGTMEKNQILPDQVPYPRIAMLWSSIRGDRSLESIAKHDLILLGVGGLGLQWEGDPVGEANRFTSASMAQARERIQQIKQINPAAIILAELYFYEYSDRWLPEDHCWWLRINGERKQFWPGTHRMDWNHSEYRRHVVQQTAALQQSGLDGVFYDNIRNESKPWVEFLKEVRDAVGDDFLILANAGYDVGSYDFAAPFLNGMMYESGWSHKRTEWDDCIQKMRHTQSLLRKPKISVIERFEEIRDHAGWPNDSRRGQKPEPDPQARYWSLCYSLIIGDYYYLFSDNTSHRHDWYPEYDKKIGLPLEPGARITPHVWQRRYENALVVVNLPGAQESYTVKLDEHARDTLTGAEGNTFTIPAGEGRILCKGLQTGQKDNGFFLGCSQVDITPPVGWRMAGNYYEKFNNGVHDPLFAKAMVWKQGEIQTAILICDVCSAPRPITNAIRQQVSQHLGIPFTNISVTATHTHAGPEYHGILWELFHEEALKNYGTDPHAPIDYQGFLIDACVQAVAQAQRNMKSVILESGVAQQSGVAFNRRFHMKDGSVRFNPGKMNPDIIRAAGPVDEDFPIVLFRDANTNKPIASFTSFAVHTAVFGGDQYSADFPGLLQRNLRNEFGEEFFSLYGQGTSGDTNHFNVFSDQPNQDSEQIASAFTETLLRTIPTLKPVVSPSLAVLTTKVVAPFVDISKEQVQEAWNTFNLQHEKNPTFLELVNAWKILNTNMLMEQEGEMHQMEVHAFRIGHDLAIVTWPHEIFVELGMALKEQSPFQTTLILTLANDFDFYIPSQKAFVEGSYEIVTSSVKPGAGEKLVEETLNLLHRLNTIP